MDFSYMNPISSHLEVELNDKLNYVGNIHTNIVWQISLDYLFQDKIRVSGNFLYDEFVFDEEELAKGKNMGRPILLDFHLSTESLKRI